MGTLDRHDEALESFEKAVEVDPKHTSAWVGRGIALGQLGRLDEALASYDKGLEAHPEHAHVWLLVAVSNLVASRDLPHRRLLAWLDKWRALAANRDDMRVTIRLAEAAVRYRAEGDERILLELPVEERRIVRQMLGIEDEDEHEREER